MEQTITKEEVLKEIDLIPETKWPDLYQLLHRFRLRAERAEENPRSVNRFAGCWQDMPEETFDGFLRDVTERRQQAFAGRRADEAEAD